MVFRFSGAEVYGSDTYGILSALGPTSKVETPYVENAEGWVDLN